VDYNGKIPIQGDGHTLLEKARSVFVQEGYSVSPISGHRFEASGGHPLHNNKNPIHGISRAVFMVSAGMLTVETDLGGVRKLRNFLVIFPPSLGLFLAVVFTLAGDFADQPPYMAIVVAFAPIAPWAVLAPVLTYVFRRRTIRTLETLLQNLQSVGKE
jgi:hypothetical protein